MLPQNELLRRTASSESWDPPHRAFLCLALEGYLCRRRKTLLPHDVWNSGRTKGVQSVKLIENWLWLRHGRWRKRSAACRVVGLIPHLLLPTFQLPLTLNLKLHLIVRSASLCGNSLLGVCMNKQPRPYSVLWKNAANGVMDCSSVAVSLICQWERQFISVGAESRACPTGSEWYNYYRVFGWHHTSSMKMLHVTFSSVVAPYGYHTLLLYFLFGGFLIFFSSLKLQNGGVD